MNVQPAEPQRLVWLQSLHPGNFAMAMASGILSIGFSIFGFPAMTALLWLFSALA